MTTYAYFTYTPAGYADDATRHWPLLIALHGAGERHIPVEVLRTHRYYTRMIELTHEDYPCVVVVPQCPPQAYWQPATVDALLGAVLASERIDPTRVYLTGFSMGGYGAWLTAGAYPQRYAAIAPICGGGNVQDAAALSTLPIWAFHGTLDDVVPVEKTMEMIEAVTAAGGHPKVTLYPEGGHNVWDVVYTDPALYAWLLAQQRE